MKSRADKAVEFAIRYGQTDGAHHKMWVIDQMVRILTGCPTVRRQGIDINGIKYHYDDLGESEEYKKIIAAHNRGDDGDDTYSWDTGVP